MTGYQPASKKARLPNKIATAQEQGRIGTIELHVKPSKDKELNERGTAKILPIYRSPQSTTKFTDLHPSRRCSVRKSICLKMNQYLQARASAVIDEGCIVIHSYIASHNGGFQTVFYAYAADTYITVETTRLELAQWLGLYRKIPPCCSHAYGVYAKPRTVPLVASAKPLLPPAQRRCGA